MVRTRGYVPQRGDVVWITLNPQFTAREDSRGVEEAWHASLDIEIYALL